MHDLPRRRRIADCHTSTVLTNYLEWNAIKWMFKQCQSCDRQVEATATHHFIRWWPDTNEHNYRWIRASFLVLSCSFRCRLLYLQMYEILMSPLEEMLSCPACRGKGHCQGKINLFLMWNNVATVKLLLLACYFPFFPPLKKTKMCSMIFFFSIWNTFLRIKKKNTTYRLLSFVAACIF